MKRLVAGIILLLVCAVAPAASEQPDWSVRYLFWSDKYAEEFEPPAPGATLSISLRTGTVREGLLERLTGEEIAVRTGKGTFTYPREQLSARSRAACFREDFSRYHAALKVSEERKAYQNEAATRREAASLNAEQQAAAAARQAGQVVLQENQVVFLGSKLTHRRSGVILITGTLKNTSAETLQGMEVTAVLKTEAGREVASCSARVQRDPLLPGQESFFRISATGDPLVTDMDLSVRNQNGETLSCMTRDAFVRATEAAGLGLDRLAPEALAEETDAEQLANLPAEVDTEEDVGPAEEDSPEGTLSLTDIKQDFMNLLGKIVKVPFNRRSDIKPLGAGRYGVTLFSYEQRGPSQLFRRPSDDLYLEFGDESLDWFEQASTRVADKDKRTYYLYARIEGTYRHPQTGATVTGPTLVPVGRRLTRKGFGEVEYSW